MKSIASSCWILFAIFALGCSHVSTKRIETSGLEFTSKTNAPSLKGDYLIDLFDVTGFDVLPKHSEILVLSDTGDIRFRREFVHYFSRMEIAMELKRVDPGYYLYAFGSPMGTFASGSIHFLDNQFRDVFPFPVPDDTLHLNVHDAIRKSDGHMLYMFYVSDLEKYRSDVEIQERNEKGQTLFTWRLLEHLHEHVDPDSIQINDMDIDSKGDLYLGFLDRDEIMKVQYPSGRILWRMSFRTWKFKNDPLNGFRYQHALKVLPNGNILVFDDGHLDRPSRAVEYKIDEGAKTAELVWEYRGPLVHSQRYAGSVQRLANGNTLIGWGAFFDETVTSSERAPIFTEVSPSGEIVRELTSDKPLGSYRVYFDENQTSL